MSRLYSQRINRVRSAVPVAVIIFFDRIGFSSCDNKFWFYWAISGLGFMVWKRSLREITIWYSILYDYGWWKAFILWNSDYNLPGIYGTKIRKTLCSMPLVHRMVFPDHKLISLWMEFYLDDWFIKCGDWSRIQLWNGCWNLCIISTRYRAEQCFLRQ
jgi:hypothetical protein